MQTAPAPRSETVPFDGPPPPSGLQSRFPRMMGYLDGLPAGIHSYPQCQARAGVLQAFLEDVPPAETLEPWVASLLRPSPRPFVPEVVLLSSIFAIADAAEKNDEQLLAWNREINRRLYGGLLYRSLMAIFSPLQLLERAPKRWESFHQGTTLVVKSTGAREAVGTLDFHAGLYTPLILEIYAGAFAAAVEHARGRDVTVQLGRATATSAEFVARWR